MLPPGVTSISNLDLCREAIKNRFADEKRKNEAVGYLFPFDYAEFKDLLTESANVILERRREINVFAIDEKNEPVIRQLFLYLKADTGFSGDLQKGIMLVGKYGSGKTLIMQAMTILYNTLIQTLHIPFPILKFIKSSELLETLNEKSFWQYSKIPLVIDEFGREPKQIMDFGYLRSPVIELLCERYDTGAWTHGTSNFTLETLGSENQYGKMTGDRIKSMFNFIELSGESRRK
jgi:DNA replication protein DnaC